MRQSISYPWAGFPRVFRIIQLSSMLICPCADGGGVRGVSELIILDRIMNRIKELNNLEELPKPCEFFDLIAGTSTGG